MMSQFLNVKDKFGNDLYFGDTGSILLGAVPNIQDYAGQLDRIRDISLRTDDVIVVGYPRSGNNWTHHMISMLLEGTTHLPPLFGADNFPFLDTFGGGLNLPPPDKPRALMSHLPFQHLPRDVVAKKVKVVYVTRNPKDVFVSQFCHRRNIKPPRGFQCTWPQFFEVMLEQGYAYGNVFDHLKDWENHIEDHPELPIFRCRYEDTKQDTLGQVELLNQFLDTGRSRQFCQQIVNACEFSNMTVSRKVSDDTHRNIFQWREEIPEENFYRKGIVGDWKNWFTVAQNEHFDEVYASKMAGYQQTFVYE